MHQKADLTIINNYMITIIVLMCILNMKILKQQDECKFYVQVYGLGTGIFLMPFLRFL
jgi:hypothetical protein